MPPRAPRILYLALGCARHVERARAVLATWAREIPAESRLVFAADAKLAELLGPEHVWACVEAAGPNDCYEALPIKMLAAFQRALEEPGWDVLFKVDDDTYAVPARVAAMLERFTGDEATYGGGYGWEVATEEWPRNYENIHGAPFRFWFFQGGAGYFVTRAALERAREALALELDRRGLEDVLTCVALSRAGVRAVKLANFSHNDPAMDRVVFGPAATIHPLEPRAQRFVHRVRVDVAAPFELADASVAWGSVGLNGYLGYDEHRVCVAGAVHRRAISAHAPSRVLLRARPGATLVLQGALNDSAAAGAAADFAIEDGQRGALMSLGRAWRAQPTGSATVVVPPDGRLTLRCQTEQRTGCHSVWLWSAPDWSPPEASSLRY